MMAKLSSMKDGLVRLTNIKYFKKEFDRVALPRLMRLFGHPRTVGKPRRGIKKSGKRKPSTH